MSGSVEINGRRVGYGYPVYVVAELSANHNKNFEQAVELIRAAKETGADAVKLHTYTPETLTVPSDKEYFRIGGGTLWDGSTLYDLYSEAYIPWEWQPTLKEIADDIGIDLFGMYANPRLIGSGIGGLLLQCIERIAFTHLGLRELYLQVRPENSRARALYRKHGYVEIPSPEDGSSQESPGTMITMYKQALHHPDE